MHPKYVDNVVMATVCLHNFIKSEEDHIQGNERVYCPPNFVDSEDTAGNFIPGEWRRYGDDNALTDIPPTSAHHATTIAYKQRDKLADYFLTTPGEVPWQYEYVRRGQHCDNP